MAVLLTAAPATAAESAIDPEVPDAEVRVSNPRPMVQEPFFLEVELSWPDGAGRLLPHPPRFSLPAGFRPGELAASTRADAGRSVVLYRLQLTAGEPGIYALEPVEIRWSPGDGAPRRSRRVAAPQVTVAGGLSQGLASPATRPAGAAGPAALVGLLLGGGLLWSWSRARRRAGSTDPRSRRSDLALARLEELLDQAGRLRQRDLPGEAVQVLGQILRELEAESPLPVERLEEIRYGGNAPRSEELDLLESRVRRHLEARRPKPGRPRGEPPRQPRRVAVP